MNELESKGESIFQDTNYDIQENMLKLNGMSQVEASNYYANNLSKLAKEDYHFTIEQDNLSRSLSILHSQSDESSV